MPNREPLVTHFLEFMADGEVPAISLLFLQNHGRVREFLAHLQQQGFKPTTQRSYLTDVVAFLKYVLNMAPQQVRLSTRSINALLVEIRARIRDVSREIVGHRLNVRRSKSDRLKQTCCFHREGTKKDQCCTRKEALRGFFWTPGWVYHRNNWAPKGGCHKYDHRRGERGRKRQRWCSHHLCGTAQDPTLSRTSGCSPPPSRVCLNAAIQPAKRSS
uniref:uncharacterized protein LOC124055920 n=1 Tax=Scatophagus argus TaxID=75038 RepID=UPI001ED82B7B|nr:uncharacterized protein LOC124055920 [Scatophagus argus]